VEFQDRGAGIADIQWESLINAYEYRLTASGETSVLIMSGFDSIFPPANNHGRVSSILTGRRRLSTGSCMPRAACCMDSAAHQLHSRWHAWQNCHAPVSPTGASPKTAPKNGAVSGAEVPVLVPISFPRIVTGFPFLRSSKPGTGRRTWVKTRSVNAKKPRGNLEFSWKNTAF
jgi:hypothetical protein